MKNLFFTIVAILLMPYWALAEEAPAASVDQLRDMILQYPENMDYRYAYATASAQTGNLAEAARAMEYMLRKHPDLPRVKLELAILKMRMEQFEESKKLLQGVLDSNPPEQVKDTVEKLIGSVDKQAATNSFSGGLQVGMNFDTNANSASSTGYNTFIDLNLPLATGSRKQRDHHKFAAATLAHSYKFDADYTSDVRVRWNSSVSSYAAEYDSLHSLDLAVHSIRTGPMVSFKDTGTIANVGASYNYVRLGDAVYLRQSGIDAVISQPLGEQWNVTYSAGFEDRDFAAAYDDRTGNAYQHKIAVNYALTQQDIFNLGFMYRNESTRQDYYDNDQREISGGYTRILPWNMILALSANYKTSKYDAADPIISSSIVREDHEKGMAASLSIPLISDIVWNTGYQYRNVNSSLQNYTYTDHRVSTSIGWQF